MGFASSLVGFVEQWQPLWLLLHILGTVLGLGGATIADVLFFRFLKDFRISKKEVEVLHFLAAIVMGAIILLILTGMLLLINQPELALRPTFQMKVLAVTVVTINGLALHLLIAPRLIKMSFHHHALGKPRISRKWHKLAFALGSVSVSSWYTVFFIAMLKSYITFGFLPLLSLYLFVLCGAIGTSQLVEASMLQHARKAAVKG